VRIMDLGVTAITYNWNEVRLPEGQDLDGLNIKIYVPKQPYQRIKLKPNSDNAWIWVNEPIGAVKSLKLTYRAMERIHMSALWREDKAALDWVVTERVNYMTGSVTQNLNKLIPAVFKPNELIFTAKVNNLGSFTSINSYFISTISIDYSSIYGYRIYMPFPFYFTTSGVSIVPQLDEEKIDVNVSLIGASVSVVNVATSVYSSVGGERVIIYVKFYDSLNNIINHDFNISVKANDYIVQNMYLEKDID